MRRTGLKVTAMCAAVLMFGAVACRSGVSTGVGVDAEARTIKIGELTGLTGVIAAIGKPLTAGHEVYFKYVNETLGGIGRDLPAEERYKVELVTRDTQYTQDGSKQQYAAIKDEVLLIAQSLGTPTTVAILDDIRDDKILTGAATLASIWLKEKYVVPAGAPYPIQFINAAQYLKDQGVTPKLGIIYQDDDYGAEGLKGLEYAASKFGWQIVAKATYKAADAAGEASLFLPPVKAMKDAGADHVFLTTTPSATGKALGVAASALQYAPRWIGNSPSWIGALAASPVAPYMQQRLWVVTDAACAWGEVGAGCEGMKLMLDNIQKFSPSQTPDYYFTFGYTQARIIHEVLEKAVADGDLTREGVVKAFESLRNVDMGGLLPDISYGEKCEDKIPTNASTIWGVDPKAPVGLTRVAQKIESSIIGDFPFC